jgi:hypothetical protein
MRSPWLLGALSFLVAACGPGGGSTRPCTFTLTGAYTATQACDGDSPVVLGLMTADSTNWLINAENDDFFASVQFSLPTAITATTYVGGATGLPWCTASVQSKAAAFPGRTASSRPRVSTGTTLGSCSITFTSAVEDSTSLTRRYVVQGTANAKVLNEGDGSSVDVVVTF